MNAFARYGLIVLAVAFAPASAGSAKPAPAWELRSPSAAAPGGGDCDDEDPEVYPGHAEIVGNRYDDDCDGLADEDMNDVPSDDAGDLDGDGLSLAMGDCDDTAATTHPGVAEIVGNHVDDDCDGLADEDAANHPSNDSADHDGDQVIIAPDPIFASGFEGAG